MKKIFLFFCLAFIPCARCESLPDSANISFFVIDLKYNSKQGIKICEMQPGQLSDFIMPYHPYFKQCPTIENFLETLSLYHDNFWFTKMIDRKKWVGIFKKYGWKSFDYIRASRDKAFLKFALEPVEDPLSVRSYHGIVYLKPLPLSQVSQFKSNYPGVLSIGPDDIYGYNDKYLMSKRFLEVPSLKNLKPKWVCCRETYSDKLAEKILKEIPSEYLVIKPPREHCGRGVIFIERKEFAKTLKLILEKKDLENLSDELMFWKTYKYKRFIVEEFVPSDSLEINGLTYNPTYRVTFLLVYDQGKLDIHFFGEFWKIPSKALEEEGTLKEHYKSGSYDDDGILFDIPNLEFVELIREQLREPLLLLYKNMLMEKSRL